MSMIGALVNSESVTMEKVALAEKIISMQREMKADAAKELFFQDFVKMQREMKNIVAKKEVLNDKDKVMYTFASFDDIRKEADPILEKYGFGSAFDTRESGDRIVGIFILIHTGGHSKSNEFAVRYSGPPKTSVTQQDASSKTMALKGAFCDGLGIVIDKSEDARILGDKITPEEASELRSRLHAVGRDEAAFLKWAGKSETFEDIPQAWLEGCRHELSKAEARLARTSPVKVSAGSAPCDSEGNLL